PASTGRRSGGTRTSSWQRTTCCNTWTRPPADDPGAARWSRQARPTRPWTSLAAVTRTIVFMPESAYGPTNNCIGIGAVLLERGHRVVFAAEASWRGRLAPLGFEEDLVDLAPPAVGSPDEQDAGAFWKDFIRETAPEFRKPTLTQLETFIRPTWQALVDGARYCEPALRDILDRTRPDVVVLDNVVAFPALLTCGAPYVRIVSCNPLEV